MSLALLFSGQGTQHPQMLPWLDGDAALVCATQAALRVDDWRLALGDAAWARRNQNVQVLLTGIALAAWQELAQALPAPAAVAGYSVGELAAFAAAGVVTAEAAIALAAERAQAMDAAAAGHPGGMVAVTGLGAARIEALCAAFQVSLAIQVAADSVVLGGRRQALAAAADEAARQGAKVSVLAIEVASHTPAMAPAVTAFQQVLARTPMRAPAVPLVCNATAEVVRDPRAAASALATQIGQTVRWGQCLDAVQARQPRCVLEIGPGSALAALWNRRFPDCPARSADEFRSAGALLAWLQRHL
jgi:[acyl-carrier-protein] S-malonyltransferase